MASPIILIDGFDKYGPPEQDNADLFDRLGGDWTALGFFSGDTFETRPPLSAHGYSLYIDKDGLQAAFLGATLPDSYNRISGSIRVKPDFGGAHGVRFVTSGTALCILMISGSDGLLYLVTGDGDTTLAVGSVPISHQSVHVISWDITFGPSGAYTVWLDGVQQFIGTGNTGNGFAVANRFDIYAGNTVFTSGAMIIDDLVLFDPSQPGYDASALTSNVVVETQYPIGDYQQELTIDTSIVVPEGIEGTGIYRGGGTANPWALNPGTGLLYLLKVIPDQDCTLNSISVYSSSTYSAVPYQGVVYTDVAGAPSMLVTTGAILDQMIGNTIHTSDLLTPQSLTAGVPIWIGFFGNWLESNMGFYTYDTVNRMGRSRGYTYVSGVPAGPLPAMTTGRTTWCLWGNCQGSAENWRSISLDPPTIGNQSQLHSSTAGDEDLYEFPALTTTPSVIYGMAVKGFIAKTDAGPRTVSFNTLSGGVDSTGTNPNQGMATSPVWQGTHYITDPATGASWTVSGLDAAKSGVSVAS